MNAEEYLEYKAHQRAERAAKIQAVISFLAILVLAIVYIFTIPSALSAEKVKYCRNAETGEIITVQAGYPCPYPTHEL